MCSEFIQVFKLDKEACVHACHARGCDVLS